MTYVYGNNAAHLRSGTALAVSDDPGKRVKITARPCWVCGNDARGKYCPPCSADVEQERNAWISRQRRKKK